MIRFNSFTTVRVVIWLNSYNDVGLSRNSYKSLRDRHIILLSVRKQIYEVGMVFYEKIRDSQKKMACWLE